MDANKSTLQETEETQPAEAPNNLNALTEPAINVELSLMPGKLTTSDIPKMINIGESGLQRSTREHKVKKFFGCITYLCFSLCAADYGEKIGAGIGGSYTQKLARNELLERNVDGTQNFINPITQCFASLTYNENYNYKGAMMQEDCGNFVLAMLKEINAHETKKHWVYRRRSEFKNVRTIMAMWSFKRKQAPDGTILNHKARLCAHGG